MEKPERQPVISVTRLTKRYGSLTAVNGLSFDIRQGEIFGFLGPNGAGKTTTINMICGISTPTSGTVGVDGNHPRDRKGIRFMFGICPQENIFWPKLTCLEQLRFTGSLYGMYREEAAGRAKELLHFMGLEDKKHALAGNLSGGMKRRLNLCLALIHDPPVLVLDEPEAGLDPQSRVLVREYIRSLAGTKTILLTTHNMDEADRLSDRVAIIDHGDLLMLDSPTNLKKTVGEGDIAEIRLDRPVGEKGAALTEQLEKKGAGVTLLDSSITVRSKNLIGSIPAITGLINDSGFSVKEMTMRENTLEDVFIHLTGRQLRS